MARVLVAGLVNLESTLRVERFPVEYAPVRYPFHGVRTTVSGVGLNVALALRTLGSEARLLSLLGPDLAGAAARAALSAGGLDGAFVLDALAATPESVILYDGAGARALHVDLKGIQEARYPEERFDAALQGCEVAALCNINFARPLLERARRAGVPVATDVHALSSPDDAYNGDWLRAAEVLFLSHELLPGPAGDFAVGLQRRFGNAVVVVGLGAGGALLVERGAAVHVPAASPRAVVNSTGAGDALFAAFLHFWAPRREALPALRRAVLFAGWKIGAAGGAEGFLDEASLLALATRREGGA